MVYVYYQVTLQCETIFVLEKMLIEHHDLTSFTSGFAL